MAHTHHPWIYKLRQHIFHVIILACPLREKKRKQKKNERKTNINMQISYKQPHEFPFVKHGLTMLVLVCTYRYIFQWVFCLHVNIKASFIQDSTCFLARRRMSATRHPPRLECSLIWTNLFARSNSSISSSSGCIELSLDASKRKNNHVDAQYK